MAKEEIQVPYTKLGTLEFSRERLGTVPGLTTQDYEWAHAELREGARSLGADAVLVPEIRIEQSTFFLFPASEIKVKGTAVKFR
jgi:uncharacterized protein YbjQ (UPF0145 family)